MIIAKQRIVIYGKLFNENEIITNNIFGKLYTRDEIVNKLNEKNYKFEIVKEKDKGEEKKKEKCG